MIAVLRRVAVVTSLVIVGVLGWIRRMDTGSASSRVPTVPVVVAARDIPEGATLDRSAVVVAHWPSSTEPAGAYGTVDSVVGRVTRMTTFRGEPIVPGRLAPEGASPGLAVRITPGKRAFGIRVDDVATLAGMIFPNSRVDIMVVIDHPNGAGKRVARLFMSNMRVLAIGPVTQAGADGRPINGAVATLEVTPEEAERLAIATTQGQIQLVLRGYGDPSPIARQPPSDVRIDVMPRTVVRRDPCAAGRDSIFRDLLRRSCAGELRFRIESPPPASPARPR